MSLPLLPQKINFLNGTVKNFNSIFMSNISQVKTDSDWGAEASRINQNFQNINVDLEKVKNSTTKFKGYFSTEELLFEKYPNPSIGEYAWVGTPYPGTVYDIVDGAWHNTTTVPDEESVDLADYYNKSEVDSKTEELKLEIQVLENKVSSLSQEVTSKTEEIEGEFQTLEIKFNYLSQKVDSKTEELESGLNSLKGEFTSLSQEVTYKTEEIKGKIQLLENNFSSLNREVNSKISELKDEIQIIKNNYESLSQKVDLKIVEFEEGIKTLKGNYDSLSKEVNSNKEELKEEIQALKNNFVALSQEEYDSIKEKDPNTFYFIYE